MLVVTGYLDLLTVNIYIYIYIYNSPLLLGRDRIPCKKKKDTA
jgi:hypothetical protein